MKPLSGNSSDMHEFGQVIKEHRAQLPTTYDTTYMVADSALYSEDSLYKLTQTALKWFPRVLAPLHEAQAVLAHAELQAMALLTENYNYQILIPTYGGVTQRWVLIYAGPRHAQVRRTVDKQGMKQGQRAVTAF